MAVIERVEMWLIELKSMVARSDAIQSFTSQELRSVMSPRSRILMVRGSYASHIRINFCMVLEPRSTLVSANATSPT